MQDQLKQQQEYNQEIKQSISQCEQLNPQFEDQLKVKDQQLLQQKHQAQTKIQQQCLQSSPELIQNSFTYQFIEESSIKEQDNCQAIAINSDCSIVIVGCYEKIKVFQLKQDVLKEIQVLNEHQSIVNTLQFMKKSKQFMSGSYDKQIIIWSLNENNKWDCQQKLNGHNGWILCLLLNINEDLIITGSEDNTIKFWMKQNHQWLCSQTITDHNNYVVGLSLNQKQNQLISCACDEQILIIEQSQQDCKWSVVQKIKVETTGCRICFINENQFIFQLYCVEHLHFYEFNDINKQYTKTKDIAMKSGGDYQFFPIKFIEPQCLIVIKTSNYVNFIRKIGNYEFKIEQSIQFGNFDLFGCVSDDGQLLITWDEESKEIQIRKYNQI
ncbi:unnamed protein product [Paramecium primaurelia]|uniref:WD40-repeat-containing domain n=1 Tax=Paramecium primaurelia TaxID=5886 RepID=A0A8S1QSK6_PARPR|nr:unnamed protein product [Paramecium primaurelia]